MSRTVADRVAENLTTRNAIHYLIMKIIMALSVPERHKSKLPFVGRERRFRLTYACVMRS
jgi:hypothetical protein